MFFLDKSHRLQEAVVDSDVPSVNIRRTIDPVRGREGEGGRERERRERGREGERGEEGREREREKRGEGILLLSSLFLGPYTSIRSDSNENCS